MSDHEGDNDGQEELPEVNDDELNETQPHDDDTAAAVEAAPVEEDEEVELPPEKPWNETFAMRLPGVQGTQQIKASDKGLPHWLRYIVTDDAVHFKHHVFPAPKARRAAEGAEGDDAQPPQDADEDPHSGPVCKPNEVLYLKQARDGTFHLVAEEEEESVRPSQQQSPSPTTANAIAGDDGEPQQESSGVVNPEGTSAAEAPPIAPSQSTTLAVPTAPALLSLKIDYVTLAAIKSPDALVLLLGVAGVSLNRLVEWAISDSEGTSSILSTLAAAKQTLVAQAQAGKKVAPPIARISIKYAPFFTAVCEDARRSQSIRQVVEELVRSGITPHQPIPPSLLLTADAMELYLLLLRAMPKSMLLQWSLPFVPEGEDQPDDEMRAAKPVSFALGSVLLDVRRRTARQAAGKSKLRSTAASVYSALLKKFAVERGEDTVVTTHYSPKSDGTLPTNLTLYQSDLLLLVLGASAENDTEVVFRDLLQRRASHPKRADNEDRAGIWHVLFMSLHNLQPWAVKALIEAAPFGRLFVKGGLARIDDFARRFLFEYDGRFADAPGACDEAVERNTAFQRNYAKVFTAKFWPELAQSEATMMMIERQGSTYLTTLLEASTAYRRVAEAVAANALPESQLVDLFEQIVRAASTPTAVVLPHTVFHSSLMSIAVEARNFFAVKYLMVQHGVVTVRSGPNAAEVELIDEALRRGDVELMQLLVAAGIKLSASLRSGYTSGVLAVQDAEAFVSRPEAATAVLEAWRHMESEREADPEKRHGLLLTIRSAA